MLVNDRKEIRYVWISPQFKPLRMQIKQFPVVETVFALLNLSISDQSDFEGNIISPSINIKKNCKRLVARSTTLIMGVKAHSATGQAHVVSCA